MANGGGFSRALRSFAWIGVAALAIGALSLSPMVAQDGPKPAEGKKEGENKEPEVKLPASDLKAQAMVKEAWAKIESLPGLAKDPLERFASKGAAKVDTSKMQFPAQGGGWKETLDALELEVNTAWTKGNVFSINIQDMKDPTPPPADNAGGWPGAGGMTAGVRTGLRSAVTRISHFLPYTLGMIPFDQEFKDSNFEFWAPDGKPADKEAAKLPIWDKDLKAVRVWRAVLGRPVFETYFIDKKGKGVVKKILRDGKYWTFEYAKGKKLLRIEKLTIEPETPPAPPPKVEDEKKDDDNDAGRGGDGGRGGGGRGGRGGGGGGGPGGGRWPGGGGGASGPSIPAGHEVFTFGERKVVGGFEISLAVTSSFEFYGNRIPVTLSLLKPAVNKDATDEMIAEGGFGPSQGFPDPTRKGEDAGKKNADEAKKD